MKENSLYTKYRPKKFSEIYGQDHISIVLRNQVKNDKISHAYIFSGTRGTGKTTCARIFSKAINCLNNVSGEPCLNCEKCSESKGNLNIHELDAASNNSVDQIRGLIDELRYINIIGGYKVYILDEAHMLSISAFNALLKTIEEPPLGAIFILSTTEIKKIPQTIISRCQKFDFRDISREDVFKNLSFIREKESMNIDDESLYLISDLSNGSMRDGISILERVYLTKDSIDINDTRNILGISSKEIVFIFIEFLSKKDLKDSLDLISEIFDKGLNVLRFIEELRNTLRDMLFIKINKGNTYILFEKLSLNIDNIVKLSSLFEFNELTSYLNEINTLLEKKDLSEIEYRVYLEVFIIKVCKSKNVLVEKASNLPKESKVNEEKGSNIYLTKDNWNEFLVYLKKNKHMVLYSLLSNGSISDNVHDRFLFKSSSEGIYKRLNKEDMIRDIKKHLDSFFSDIGSIPFELDFMSKEFNHTISDKLTNYFGNVPLENK